MAEGLVNPQLAQAVVLAAIQAAGPAGSNPAAWRAKINDLVPEIAAMVRPESKVSEHADHVLNAFVFAAEIVDWELEESSQRIILRLKSETTSKRDKSSDGTESIRTERIDSARGRAQSALIERAGKGAKVLVYKHMDDMATGDKVRVLAHLVVLAGGASTAGTERRAANPVSQDVPPAHQPAQQLDPLLKRFNALPGKVAAAVAKRARAEGLNLPLPDTPEGRARFETIINEEEDRG